MDYELIRAVLTVVMFALFLGIVAWTWSDKRRERFDSAAQLPLEEEFKLTDSWQREERRK
jgi:cytochrome c oxidase cbb3-type subunit 4